MNIFVFINNYKNSKPISSEKDISDLYFFKVDFTLDKPIPCSAVPFLLMS